MDSPSPSSDPNSYDSVRTRPKQIPHSNDGVTLASTKPKKRAGRTKFKETRHPVYRGVRMRNKNKWVCEVREPNKKTRIWLGTYPTAEMAARAHDVAALALRGNLACLNFADSVSRLPVPVSNDPKDICKAAAQAAEAFRPTNMGVDDGDIVGDASDDKGSDEMSEDEGSIAEVDMNRYVDEEAIFYMPRLIADMAEGMLIPPPRCLVGWSSDDMDSQYADVSLWNFSE
ncbi:dehydration-responsive element-binding protein 1E-like [Rutidosis leptorrhynchoides]|uniref:dehydration-responsive element-binding protein 1E-like n=1 Tax=Rutidosis leptorrhynchoides TaxID=125765 RepID=UPI003A98E915